MDNFHTRGPQCSNTPYQQEMNYPHTVTPRNSQEDLIHDNKPVPELGRKIHQREDIQPDQIYGKSEQTSTEEQLGLSQEIYNLKINIYNLSAENSELQNQIVFLKEQNTDLSCKLTNQAITDLKNYEEEKRQWKLDREELERKLNLYNGIIRGLDEDKRHQGEKISMLEIALKSYHPSSQHVNEYPYNPRDAMNTGYNPHGNSIQHLDPAYTRGHSSEFTATAYGKTNASSGYYTHSQHTTVPLLYDPTLTCDFCGSKFLYGEIQKLREHLNTMHPKN